jgi:uncharacterized protein involved in response to NO
MRRRASLVAVDIVVLVIVIMAGRVFPMFTRNATGVASIRSSPRLDALAAGSMGLLTIADAAALEGPMAALCAGVAGALALARTAHGGARHAARIPLLWILHAGYAWIPLGLALRAWASLSVAISPAVATHALTVGAIGGLTLGMMARVGLGHTGRPLAARWPVVLAFALVMLAALARVVVPLTGLVPYRASVFTAGILWTLAFGLFLVAYLPILTSPRVDGKPG